MDSRQTRGGRCCCRRGRGSAGAGRLFIGLTLVILLETGHYTQVRLTLGAMVFGLAPQNPSMCVYGVPAKVTAQCRTRPNGGTVTGTSRVVQRKLSGWYLKQGFGQNRNEFTTQLFT